VSAPPTAGRGPAFGIAVRVGVHCAPDAHKVMGSYPKGTVRMSPGYFNTMEHMERAVQAVELIAKGRLLPVS